MSHALDTTAGLWFQWSRWRWFAGWTGIAMVLHVLWEIGQLPLYAVLDNPGRWRVAGYVLHCTLGDALIAMATFLITALAWRRMSWPGWTPWRGGLFTVMIGVAYTVASEWINVYVIGGWAYARAMPLVLGIGLAPLLQWVIVPVLALVILRKLSRRMGWRNDTMGRGGSFSLTEN